jgi:protein-L-isoaspartate(D-aspartate) O-methyltransferase
MTTELYGPRLPVHDYEALRHLMIEHQLRDVHDVGVLAAMREVPRHFFAPESSRGRAYDDVSIPIGYGQTLPSPRVVAWMLQTADVRCSDRVLEVGVTSGYETALLSLLAKEVYALEVIPGLERIARQNLAHADYLAVHFVHGEAGLGWPDAAPYDLIVLAGSSSSVPEPLIEQLVEGGRIVFPVGPGPVLSFKRLTRRGANVDIREIQIPKRQRLHAV